MSDLLLPSYEQGFTRYAALSADPGVKRGGAGMWLPSLGASGATLYDIDGHNDGVITGAHIHEMPGEYIAGN